MFADCFDLALSTSSAAAARAYNHGLERILSLNAGAAAAFERAVAADADFALAHAALALTASAEGDHRRAAAAIVRARALVPSRSARERGHVEAVAAIITGEGERAVRLIRAQFAAFPREALLLRHAGTLIAFSGRPHWREEVCALYAELSGHYGDDWWFTGAYALYLQECGHLDQAGRLALRSLARHPRNATAAHALAHVLHVGGDHVGVRDFLTGWLDAYDRDAPFHCHLSWHLALAELDGGRDGAAVRRYQREIWPVLLTRPAAALPDAASLLWRRRLHLGAGRPLPWDDVADAARRFATGSGLAFLDAHVALALAGAGDTAALDQLIGALHRLDQAGHPTAGSVALPLVLGVAAFAAGDHEAAIRRIEPIAGEIVRLGGSNVQREVFTLTLLAAYLHTGRTEQARALWQRLDAAA